MGVHSALMSEYYMCACCLGRLEEGTRSLGTGDTDGHDPPLYVLKIELVAFGKTSAHNC